MMEQLISAVIIFFCGGISSVLCIWLVVKRRLISHRKLFNKYKVNCDMLKRWVSIKQQDGDLSFFFAKYGYKEIALYGLGEIGKLLCDDIKDKEATKIKYIIKSSKNEENVGIKIIDIDDIMDEVDLVIVTEPSEYDTAVIMLENRVDCPIIALDEIIFEL